MASVTHTPSEERALEGAASPPAFWPTDMIDELKVASAIRKLIDVSEVDIYNGDSVAEYGMRLQAMSGSAAELMARVRTRLEEARGEAIIDAMTDERIRFDAMSATLQNKYVDSRISVHHAAYTYAEYLNKRLSYAMDYVRSLLGYIREDMYRNRTIPQHS